MVPWKNGYNPIRGGSRISVKVVRMYKGIGVRFGEFS